MHLSNQQILELNADAHAHLKECSECSNKLANLEKMRERLADQETVKAPDEIWQRLRTSYPSVQKEQQIQKTEKRVTFWQITSLALAASLTAVVLFPWSGNDITVKNQGTVDVQLANLIQENNVLQRQLKVQLTSNKLNRTSVMRLQADLSNLDKAIQQAYVQKLSNTEKSELWRQRQSLIKQSLYTINQPKVVRI